MSEGENSSDAFAIETKFSNWIELILIGDFISRIGYVVPTVRNDAGSAAQHLTRIGAALMSRCIRRHAVQSSHVSDILVSLSLSLSPSSVIVTPHEPDGRKSNVKLNWISNRRKTSTKIDHPPAVRITLVLVIPIMPDDLKNGRKYEYNEGSIDEDIKINSRLFLEINFSVPNVKVLLP